MMNRYVALLRAVNVAGHVRLRSAQIERLFRAAGARDVVSFGHAGNVLFGALRGAAVVAKVRDAIARQHGERPVIVLRAAAELVELVAAEPFAACGARRADKLYVVFLARKPARLPRLPSTSSAERLTAFARHGHHVLIVSRRKPSGFYGFPNAFVETAFGVPATARNWSTVTQLAALLAR